MSPPIVGGIERDAFGSFRGEADIAPGLRVPVTYVPYPDNVEGAEVARATREVVELVAREEEALRRRASAAWLPTFHEECPKAREWDADRLARSFTLIGIILGNTDPTFILEYRTTLPVDKRLKTWFKADGALSHISGHLD